MIKDRKSHFRKRRHTTNARHGKTGLAERLRDAKTLAELDKLALHRARYIFASAQTRRWWDRAEAGARKRLTAVI